MTVRPYNENYQLWDRVKGETQEQYEHFLSYIELPKHRRSIDNAYRVFKNVSLADKSVRAPGFFRKLYSKFDWQRRADAYDRHRQAIVQQASDKKLELKAEIWQDRRIETAEKDWKAAEKLRDRAHLLLDLPVHEEEKFTKDDHTTTIITPQPAANYSRAANMLQKASEIQWNTIYMMAPPLVEDDGFDIDECEDIEEIEARLARLSGRKIQA